jgi:DNA-directed RNA polymerase subunit RPC12/RpoP
MNIVNIHLALNNQKEHSCPNCSKVARLIADIDERKPRRDKKGDLQYYCLSCHTQFSVDRHGRTSIIR